MSTLKAKEIIKEKGMTIEEVASRMGITKGSLSAALSGNPTVIYLKRVADAILEIYSDEEKGVSDGSLLL